MAKITKRRAPVKYDSQFDPTHSHVSGYRVAPKTFKLVASINLLPQILNINISETELIRLKWRTRITSICNISPEIRTLKVVYIIY
jgi:hypothetical protein